MIDRKKNGLAFVAVVGVVDLKQVGLETLVYLVGQQANQVGVPYHGGLVIAATDPRWHAAAT